ncbi:LytR/AlgR family response regulator transcription factor [Zunongwangia pacifica]|uniref:LytTR family DNA-binding domain-containing protein n=1 Tax=Zunongwangia pacifica TaxID=2911062 RepID=A0A9X2CQS4_9FLAO|nr:LytTR family DNA-binding domain-containing protein [Zunongwangia pacifica]MCL6220323.1 LytTR family DNA-binding domain-containing protein [Zunongwangia pacifica]
MIKCMVVDDKPLAIDVLTHYIAKIPVLHLTFSTDNPLEALNKVLEGEVDLVFLDIQMPELSGIQFMKIVKGKCLVILTTAYADYALEGFDHDAVDYLLKPVSFERFYKAIEKAQLILKGLAEKDDVKTSETETKKIVSDIFVKTEYKLVRVHLDEILYVKGLQNYLSIYTTDEKITSLQTMKKIEEQLPTHQFIRVHKSYIVSINKIESIQRNRIRIAGITIALGEVYRKAFYDAIATN